MADRLILAPIRGITTPAYRTCFNRHFPGLDGAMAPFVSTTAGNRAARSHFREIDPDHNDPLLPLIPQLIGRESTDFLHAAEQIAELGYTEVNWNLGCPAPMVAKKRRGSGLLPYPDEIIAFLEALEGKLPCTLSIKIRLGSTTDDDLIKLLPRLAPFSLSAITIHPRTAAQMYSGKVNLARYEEALAASPFPVLFSGDIFSLDFFAMIKNRFPTTHSWMLGRGLLTNPYLLELLRNPIPPQKLSTEPIARFHEELFAHYRSELFGPAPVLGRMKELWGYLHGCFLEGEKAFKNIRKCNDLYRYSDVVENLFKTGTVVIPRQPL